MFFILAISPRDWPQYHEHFSSQKQDIIKDIVSLFKEKIKTRFPVTSCKYLNHFLSSDVL